MSCNFIWYNLPKQLTDIIEPFKAQLSKEAQTIIWHNLPNRLTKLYNELAAIKPSCKIDTKFIWYTLNQKAEAICTLIECINAEEPVEVDYDVDITSTDWGALQTKEGWLLLFGEETITTITDFSVIDGRTRFNVITDSTDLDLTYKNVVIVNRLNVPSLIGLDLSHNQIVDFNPTIPLPSNLELLYIQDNQIVTFNPTLPLPNSIADLILSDNQIVTFNPTLPLPSSLFFLVLGSNQIVTFNPTIALPNGIEALDLQLNQIVTFNPTLPLPSSLKTITLNTNQIVTFNPSIALPNTLEYIYLYANQIVEFNPSIALPSSLIELRLDSNQMTTLGYTNSEPWASNLHSTISGQIGFTDNVDSASGTNLETILLSKGWVVNT